MRRDGLSRRTFLGAAGVALGCGWARAQYPQVPGKYPCPPDKRPPLSVRQNVSTLSAQQLDALKHGVEVMKSRSATDPTSWSFQANIHGTLGPVTSPLFNQCEHGTIQFFSWHRGYLYYFERILRAASGDPTLSLPYWDWTAQRALPEPYRNPASASNPLYDGTRHINDGSMLPTSVVSDDLNTALGFTDFFTAMFTGFSPSLEGSPHGAVHVLTGGNMGSVPTAANDPIFWLHHCNIDRLWDYWLNLDAGRADPTDSSFLDQQYSYADENGQTVTVKVSDILTSSGLGYRYDNVPNPAAMATLAIVAAQGAAPEQEPKVVASSAPAAAPEEAVTPPAEAAAAPEAEGRPLGFQAETVNLSVQADAGAALTAAARAAAPSRRGLIFLDLKGVHFMQPPSFTYEVFLNLPADETDRGRIRAHRVGTVNFFVNHGHGGAEHEAGGGEDMGRTFDQRFDVTAVVGRLRASGDWNADALSVTLRPLTAEPPAGQEDAMRQRAEQSAQDAKITYERIDLLTR